MYQQFEWRTCKHLITVTPRVHHGVSNHALDNVFNSLFEITITKTAKLRIYWNFVRGIYYLQTYWPFVMGLHRWPVESPHKNACNHYSDVIMDTIASQITSLTIVYSDADQRKHQSSAPLAFVRGIHRGPVNSPHKWPVTRKQFPFDDVFMIKCFHVLTSSWCLSARILPWHPPWTACVSLASVKARSLELWWHSQNLPSHILELSASISLTHSWITLMCDIWFYQG